MDSNSQSSNHGKKSGLKRRRFLQALGALPLAAQIISCSENSNTASQIQPDQNDRNPTPAAQPEQKTYPPAIDIANSKNFKPGYLSILQGPTSDTETLINIISPRLKTYTYEVINSQNVKVATPTTYERVTSPTFYVVDKLHIHDLAVGETYTLLVKDKTTTVDKRSFKTLDIAKSTAQFAQLSCMSDDYRFEDVIDPMWTNLRGEKIDFVVMTGDMVYVDSKEFVERKKATEFDVWQRYTDSLARIPIYHWDQLIPIFAIWDDHDYGTNDGDENFIGKAPSTKIFDAFFGGNDLKGVWEKCQVGTSSVFEAFNQRFFLMDDRSFRKPNSDGSSKTDAFGHWGEEAHKWLITNLAQQTKASWIFNGNQLFSGISLDYKESFQDNHPAEFNTLLAELNAIKSPVVFASGDVHLSEIMAVEKTKLGYETYEFTASSMHSYVGKGWNNPLRLKDAYTTEFNYFVHTAKAETSSLDISMKCQGLQPAPYFTKSLRITR